MHGGAVEKLVELLAAGKIPIGKDLSSRMGRRILSL